MVARSTFAARVLELAPRLCACMHLYGCVWHICTQFHLNNARACVCVCVCVVLGPDLGYYLDENAGWTLTEAELHRAITKARKDGANPKAMVVINPGNPTGQCMGETDLQMIVRFCERERLVLLADEVYQENVYADTKSFVSLKKVVRGMGPTFDKFELVSFHSTSKGIIGECGRRGGYMELVGIDPAVQASSPVSFHCFVLYLSETLPLSLASPASPRLLALVIPLGSVTIATCLAVCILTSLAWLDLDHDRPSSSNLHVLVSAATSMARFGDVFDFPTTKLASAWSC